MWLSTERTFWLVLFIVHTKNCFKKVCNTPSLVISSQNLKNKIIHNTIFKKHSIVQSHFYANMVSIAWSKNFSSSLG